MGISLFGSRSNWGRGRPQENNTIINKPPTPYTFTIIRYKEFDKGLLLVELKYFHSTNYEGRKIILFRNKSLEKLKSQKTQDPHFRAKGKIIARFEPTENGWDMASVLASNL